MMKNLDIEKLERKNIYKVPDNFFETVQANVLQETVHKIQPVVAEQENAAPSIGKKWWYAAAAAVVLIFGMTFFFTNNQPTDGAIVQNENAAAQEETSEKTFIADAADLQTEEVNTDITTEAEPVLTSVAKNNQITKKPVTIAKIQPTKKTVQAAPKVEEEMEQILQSFTTEELALLSQNMEQDIYLDIYN